jgi:glycosyltransferase involved in cell wall biosynthesis
MEPLWIDYMEESKTPLLSICIPTYNRSKMLRICLLSILNQIKGYEKDVEVIVSDNCSDDDTKQVVEWAKQYGPIRYHRNELNIGAGPNFFLLSNELATGEYCWLIGDDDFLQKDALSRLIATIKQKPKIDMFFSNCTAIEINQLKQMIDPVSSNQFPDNLKPFSKNLNDFELKTFDDLFNPEINPYSLAFLPSSIFRRKLWSEASKGVKVSIDNFRDIETTYPHAICLVKSMRTRKVFYFGNPLFVRTNAGMDWQTKYPLVWVVRLLELLDYFESLGIDNLRIKKYRNKLLRQFAPSLVMLYIRRGKEFGDYLDYRKPINRYMHNRGFLLSFLFLPIQSMKKLLRRLKRTP